MDDDELLDDLRARGVVDSEGAFSIDLDAARRKMAEWRLAHPTYWALGPVMLAVAAGATQLHMHLDLNGHCRFEYDGRPLPLAWVEALGRGDTDGDEVHRALVAAYELAMAVGVREFRVRSPDERAPMLSGLQGLVQRLSGAVTRIDCLSPKSAEICRSTAVESRCVFAPIDVFTTSVDGGYPNPLSPPLTGHRYALAVCHLVTSPLRPGTRLRVDLTDLGSRLTEAAAAGEYSALLWIDAATARTTAVINGVSFVVPPERLGIANLKCVVAAPDLLPDLSMAGVVENSAFIAVMDDISAHAVNLVQQVATRYHGRQEDAVLALRCCESVLKNPRVPLPQRCETLALFLQLMGRAIDWEPIQHVAENMFRLFDQGPRDEGDRLVMETVESDARIARVTADRLGLILGVLGRCVDALALQTSPAEEGSLECHHQGLMARAAGRTAEGEAMHGRVLETTQDPTIRLLARIEMAWCALARDDGEEALRLGADGAFPAWLRVKLLEVSAEACVARGDLDAAVERMQEAALLAAEHELADAVEMAVAWRRIRIRRGDPIGLGDSLSDGLHALLHRLLQIPLDPAERLLNAARSANAKWHLHYGERALVKGEHTAALDSFKRLIKNLGEEGTRQPHLHATALLRIAAVARAQGRFDAADAVRAQRSMLEALSDR